MRVLEINSVPYGSTGKIMFSIADLAENMGDSVLCATGFSWHKCYREDWRLIGSLPEKTFHMYMDRITGLNGCFSLFSTKRFLKIIDKFSPDIVHIHNLHGWYINLPLFFGYIKEHKLPIVWTLHDCWAVTGHCPHFEMIKCDKWTSGCCKCPLKNSYPKSVFDSSKRMYGYKQNWFSGIENMFIVTPSVWLSDIVKRSYLHQYPIQVINNGIDLNVFKPSESNIKNRLRIPDNVKIVLGVSLDWNNKKGLDVFVELSRRLDETYKIVLVGIDGDLAGKLPESILTIHRTDSQKELAEIYSSAEVFVNPTHEDTFPTVNIEALACGTPVVTFDTGGSPEIIDKSSGCVVQPDNIDELEEKIKLICRNKAKYFNGCLDRAKCYDKNDRFNEYYELFRRIYDRSSKM